MCSDVMNMVDLFKCVDNLPIKRLQKLRDHIQQLIKDKTPADRAAASQLNVDDFVSYHQNFVDKVDVIPIVRSLKNCEKFQSSTKTETLWLSQTNEDYEWVSRKSGKVTKNCAVPISNFPEINNLLNSVNKMLDSDLNSCLVCFYPNEKSGIRMHDDFEQNMDNSQPIAVVSFGAERSIQFYNNYQAATEDPVKELHPENGSLYVMKARCQELFRHMVPPATEYIGERFSLSFRRIIRTASTPRSLPLPPMSARAGSSLLATPIKPRPSSLNLFRSPTRPSAPPASPWTACDPSAPNASLLLGPSQSRPIPSAPPADSSFVNVPLPNQSSHASAPVQGNPFQDISHRKICLLLGTSMTKWVNPELVSDIYTEFINVSHSGARVKNRRPGQNVPDVGEMLENFVAVNPEKVPRVNKVILAIGTNDIRHYRTDNGRQALATPGNMSVFYKPLENLVKSLRYFFGRDVVINFQCVLPMRIMYTYTVANFLNFNHLLQELCFNLGCTYLDWFKYFLDSDGCDINKHLYADNVHLNRNGYDIIHRFLKNVADTDRFSYFHKFYQHK